MYVSAISIRFSRGRSTPARRAMRAVLLAVRRSAAYPPGPHGPAPASDRGCPRGCPRGGTRCGCRLRPGWCSALALLVAQVLADDHDPAVPADHLALVADGLDARLDLHGCLLLDGCQPRGQLRGWG